MAARVIGDRALLLAFLLSGIAALGYELLWTRLLALALGSETLGVLGVLAGFFAGLAVGSWVMHERARRSPDPVRLFAILELVAAGYAVLSPHLLHALVSWLPPLLGEVAGDNDTAGALVATVTIAGLVLLPATVCMGATLAALVEARRRVHADESEGSGIGRLYGINTLGATLGVVLSIHVVLPWLGFAVGAAFLASIAVAAVVIAVRWRNSVSLPATPSASAPARVIDTTLDPDPDVVHEPWLLYLLLFGTGLVGVGLEVVGIQVLSQVLENTVYTFADILAVYLIGTGVGAWLYAQRAPRWVAGRPATVAGAMLLVLALWTVGCAAVLAHAQEILDVLAPVGSSYGAHLVAEAMVATLVFAGPTLVMGALFTHVTGLLAGRGIGRAYSVNTIGAATAPFVFGLWLVPSRGYTDAWFAVAFGYLLLLVGFGWFRRFPTKWMLGAMVAVLGSTVVIGGALGEHPLVLVETDDDWAVIDVRETIMGVVVVSEHKGNGNRSGSNVPLRRLQVGQHFRMGGASAFGERRMGHIPLLLTTGAKSALFLGVGTGATLSGVRSFDSLAHIEAIELVPAVTEMMHHFEDTNENVHHDPRLDLHTADARRWLAASRRTYDVIVADLFHPARDGAGSLYAREHFVNGRAHLADGGTFAQWLPLHQLTPDDLRIIVRTFLDVFPEVHSFLGIYNVQTPALVLIGRVPPDDRPLSLTLEAIEQRLAKPVYASLLMSDARDLFGAYLLDRDALAAFAGEGPLNTDLNPRLLFDTPRSAYVDAKELAWSSLVVLLPLRTPAPRSLLTSPDPERLAHFWTDVDRFSQALGSYLRGEVARVEAGSTSGAPREALEHYLAAYASAPEFTASRGMLYQSARQTREAAELVYPRLLESTPDDPRVYQEYLGYLQRIGDRTRFDQVLAVARQKFPPPPTGEPEHPAKSPASGPQ